MKTPNVFYHNQNAKMYHFYSSYLGVQLVVEALTYAKALNKVRKLLPNYKFEYQFSEQC